MHSSTQQLLLQKMQKKEKKGFAANTMQMQNMRQCKHSEFM